MATRGEVEGRRLLVPAGYDVLWTGAGAALLTLTGVARDRCSGRAAARVSTEG